MLLSILEYNWSRILFVAFLIFSALDVNKDVNRDTTRATTTVTPATTQPPGFQIFETIIGAAADNMAPNTPAPSRVLVMLSPDTLDCDYAIDDVLEVCQMNGGRL